jgi:hypothetical protein
LGVLVLAAAGPVIQAPPIAITIPRPAPTPDREEEITVYRGVNATNPGAFRVDPDGVSVFETLPAGYKFAIPFRLRYTPPNTELRSIVTDRGGDFCGGRPLHTAPFFTRQNANWYKIEGTVGVLLAAELDGGTATYTPSLGGPGHWSLNFSGKAIDEIKKLLSDFAKQYKQ